MKKVKGLLILLGIYVVAFVIALLSTLLYKDNMSMLFTVLIADIVATTVVFAFGLILKTASVYDPYWSVQSIVIYICLMIYYERINLGIALFGVMLLTWAVRLTYNFIKNFDSISYVDWRYKKIKDTTGKFYPIVDFIGINLIPTLVVYAASVPFFLYVIENKDFSVYNLIGYAIMMIGVLLEYKADIDMHKFIETRKSRSEIIRTGLWKYSRHPNYLGEILFWYGVGLVFILPHFNQSYYIMGAIINTCLFLFISIPLAEGHLKTYKEGYLEYKKETRMLLPIKK